MSSAVKLTNILPSWSTFYLFVELISLLKSETPARAFHTSSCLEEYWSWVRARGFNLTKHVARWLSLHTVCSCHFLSSPQSANQSQTKIMWFCIYYSKKKNGLYAFESKFFSSPYKKIQLLPTPIFFFYFQAYN